MELLTLHRGTAPLLISLPHDGSAIPDALAARMTESARTAPDTDWFVSRLYDFARVAGRLDPGAGAFALRDRPESAAGRRVAVSGAEHHRAMPDRAVQRRAGLSATAKNRPSPKSPERVERYWRPYHDALPGGAGAPACARTVGCCCGKGIRSGRVCRSCSKAACPISTWAPPAARAATPPRRQRLESVLAEQSRYSWVSNGRFKGGYITRHYGRPAEGIEAIQLELAQCNYMDEEQATYEPGAGRPSAGTASDIAGGGCTALIANEKKPRSPGLFSAASSSATQLGGLYLSRNACMRL